VLIELLHRFRFGLPFPLVLEGSLGTFRLPVRCLCLDFALHSAAPFDPVMECAFPTQASSCRGIMHWIRGLPGEEFRGKGFEVSQG
jgi:hypothetical protein